MNQTTIAGAAELFYKRATENNKLEISSADAYRREINRFAAYLEVSLNVVMVNDITTRHIESYLRSKRHLSKFSQARTTSVLKTFFDNLYIWKVIDDHPMVDVERPDIDHAALKPLNDAEEKELLATAGLSEHPERDLALLHLLLYYPMTAGTLTKLSWTDFSDSTLESSSVKISIKGKQYPLRRDTLAILRRLKKASDGTDLLFISQQTNGQYTVSGIAKILARLGEKAKIKRLNSLRLKDTYILHLIQDKTNEMELRDILNLNTSGLSRIMGRYENYLKSRRGNSHPL